MSEEGDKMFDDWLRGLDVPTYRDRQRPASFYKERHDHKKRTKEEAMSNKAPEQICPVCKEPLSENTRNIHWGMRGETVNHDTDHCRAALLQRNNTLRAEVEWLKRERGEHGRIQFKAGHRIGAAEARIRIEEELRALVIPFCDEEYENAIDDALDLVRGEEKP